MGLIEDDYQANTDLNDFKCFTFVGHYRKNIHDSITYIGAFKHLERRGHYFYRTRVRSLFTLVTN